MHNNWEEMLPFYIAGTLPKNDLRRLENHLAGCAECRKSLAEWQRIADAVREDAASQMRDLPPLAPRVLSLATQQAGARTNQALTYDFARAARIRSRSTTVTLVAAALTVFLLGTVLTLMVLSGVLPFRIVTSDPNVVLLPTETETPTPTESITPIPSQTDVPPSLTTVPSQTDIPPSLTTVPSQTTVPPTVTLVPSQTDIPPSLTLIPSQTPVPPTATVMPPTATTVPPTPVPPTIAPPTIVPPTATTVPPTRVPPSATPQPQIIVIEPSMTPVTPTPIIPTRVPSTAIPPTTAFVAPTEALLVPDATDEPQLFSMQSMMAAATCTAQGAVAGSAINLYAGPGVEYVVITSFTQGDELTALAQSDNGWIRVQSPFDGVNEWVGWVPADQVFLSGECADLPIIPAEALTDEPPTPESTDASKVEPEMTAD
ncbi:MAG: zf-HC2 domain-containing protein, partial [Anaerolineae bacterium]|nr:zf-HC2 domain-containing protein [Anaerolineae bacterium]